jgi:uncharacterized protein (PEP-CTERM system associated)
MIDHAMNAAEPDMPRLNRGRLVGGLGLTAALLLAWMGGAAAFPLLDIENTDGVPQGTELAAPDALDLRHQLQLANGLSAPPGGGWTFLPRIDWQEELTDNALQAHSPRTADLVSFFSPGLGLAGDMPRVKLTFDFAPTLSLYARTSKLNSLTEQMNGLANITVVPDLVYVDVRAVAGVQSLYGGVGGLGGAGGAGSATAASQGGIPNLAGNGQGLNKNNEVQTTSFGVSPYLLRRFGDWGTGRLGYSVDVTQSDALSGFAASPIPTGGANAQTLVTNEQTAHFVTGDILDYMQDSIDVDLQQNQTTSGSNVPNAQTGIPVQTTQHSSSTRAIITDQVNYEVNRSVTVFASGGHEDIHYSGISTPSIHDLTWSLGTTLTPNPDSQLTLSYGHQNGSDSLTANGHYALTPRTLLSVSYGSTLGTQLENVQNQLNLATSNGNGGLVNGQTGGQLFGNTNALGVQTGVFRTTTLTVGTQTSLDRDIISLNFLMAHQTSASGTNASSSSSKTASVSWLHQMRPDMTVSASLSYAVQDQTTGVLTIANPGNNTTIATSLAWQWQISDTVSSSLRYSFFDRQSPVSAFQIYQNMLILGISKTF